MSGDKNMEENVSESKKMEENVSESNPKEENTAKARKPIVITLMQGEGEEDFVWIATDKTYHMVVTNKDPEQAVLELEGKLQKKTGSDDLLVGANLIHRELADINIKHKISPFSVVGSNYYRSENGAVEKCDWNWGWLSKGFGTKKDMTLNEALDDCINYAKDAKPKTRTFLLNELLRNETNEKILKPILKEYDGKKEEISEIFWTAYNLGSRHKEEQVSSIYDNYDWSKWDYDWSQWD